MTSIAYGPNLGGQAVYATPGCMIVQGVHTGVRCRPIQDYMRIPGHVFGHPFTWPTVLDRLASQAFWPAGYPASWTTSQPDCQLIHGIHSIEKMDSTDTKEWLIK